MIRQTITLDKYTYIVDLYKASSDLVNNKHYEEFVMIYTFDIMNSIMFYKDVYFISKSIIESCIDKSGKLDTDLLGQKIAYPITNDYITLSYSTNYKRYNSKFTEDTFVLDINDESDIKNILNSSLEPSKLLCDKLRIWLPITNSKLQGIIHVSNIINDIRFHYICQNLSTFETDASSEMKVGNNIYSEYYDVWIPNVEYLFEPSTNYIKETFNITQIKQKIEYFTAKNEYITLYPTVYFDKEGDNIIKKFSLEAYKTPGVEDYNIYLIKDNYIKLDNWNYMFLKLDEPIVIENDEKVYLVIKHNEEEVAKYDIQHEEIKYQDDNIYSSMFLMILPFYIDKYKSDEIDSNSKMYFDMDKALSNNILANPIIVTIWPFDRIDEDSKSYISSKNSIENSDIFTLSKDIKLKINFEFVNNESDLNNYGAYVLRSKFLYSGISDNETMNQYYLKKLKLSMFDYLYDNKLDNKDFDEDIFNPNIEKCGYVIEAASDNNFKEKIFEYVKNIEIDDENSVLINDYDFELNFGYGESIWNSYPNTLVIRVRFIDKISYTIINSNPIFITKENFKYIINGNDDDDNENVIHRIAFHDANRSYNIADEIYNNEEEQMNLSYFNFIDKINCTIISKEEDTNKMTNSKTSQKIIYKPVFYKVRDLQQIKIKSGITQNIGVNLSEIISKADTFKIVIDGTEYPEIARNDGYVIFKINSQLLNETSGSYNLLNQDDEYISDGTWYVY